MRIRTGGPADADEIVQVRNASWRAAYRGIISEDVLDALPEVASEQFVRNLARRREYAHTFVAEKGPNVIGFASVGWARAEVEEDAVGPGVPGEVWSIYVHPDHWGRGTGFALMREAHQWLTERDMLPIRVWELIGNETGRKFYDRYGFVPDEDRSSIELRGKTYPTERLSLPRQRVPERWS
ncbi:GNAT family N-acetyltransferase [Glycomyces sp. NPDC046736]|uniref:GNAT family N-acetyltransferase n=1 Tax=Glycomyces sp. NPDC046736 TaxID=3155615 RepID=UPI0033CD1610